MSTHFFARALQNARHPGQVFYGWWIVGFGSAGLTVWSATYTYGFSAMFLPLSQELAGGGRVALSGAFSLIRLETGLLGPIQGILLDRFGSRRVMILGYLLFGLGLILLSQAQTVTGFYLLFAFMALGATFSGSMAVTTAVVNWFRRQRTLALGITLTGSSLGGLLVPVLVWSITSHGWRPTVVGTGIFVWLIGIPLASMIRRRPEDHGLLPDGATVTPTDSGIEAATVVERHIPVHRAVRTATFWMLASAHSVSLVAWSAVTVHQIPHLVDAGMSHALAAAVFGLATGMFIPGRIIAGLLARRVEKRRVAVAAFLGTSAALVILAFTHQLTGALMFAVVYGLSFGARGVLMPTLRADYFGRGSYATLTGFTDPILMLGLVVGPLFAGFMHDWQGDYQGALLVIAVVNLVGGALIALVKSPR